MDEPRRLQKSPYSREYPSTIGPSERRLILALKLVDSATADVGDLSRNAMIAPPG
jgi:hypothetical protein